MRSRRFVIGRSGMATVLVLALLALGEWVHGEEPAPEAVPPNPPVADVEMRSDRPMTASWTNGFVAKTADDAFGIHIGGRAEFDNSWYTQDSNLLLGPTADTRLTDGSLFRRARLRADGRMWDFIDFAAEVNFANIQDASNVEN